MLWDGDDPETAELAPKVRRLVDDGMLNPAAAQLAVGMYGLAGPDVLRRQLDLLLTGHDWLWGAIGQGTRLLFERKTPYHHEPDLVGRIGYRELNYGAVPDGRPLDPAVSFREMATGGRRLRGRAVRPHRRRCPSSPGPPCVISGGA